MASWGSVDVRGLTELRDKLQNTVNSGKVDDLMIDITNQLSNRALRTVKNNTPVGQYSGGRTGGHLRRNWKITPAVKNGLVYESILYNPVYYAPFVEYGHRTRGGGGWVEGRFMMTSAIRQVDDVKEQYIRRKVNAFVQDIFEGR